MSEANLSTYLPNQARVTDMVPNWISMESQSHSRRSVVIPIEVLEDKYADQQNELKNLLMTDFTSHDSPEILKQLSQEIKLSPRNLL